MNGEAVGELLFMMVVLKLPVLYLAGVVYWAIHAEPRPPEPALRPALPPRGVGPTEPPARERRRRDRPSRGPRPRPHGAPVRTYARRDPAIRTGAD